MEIAINKIIAIIIMIVVILVVLIIIGVPMISGQQLNVQDKLRSCCQNYLANGCPDDVNDPNGDNDYTDAIQCPCTIKWTESDAEIKCEDLLFNWLSKMGWHNAPVMELKDFCYCKK